MKIAVTGAAGFIGGQLVQRLASDGHQVRALVRSASQINQSAVNIEYILGDLLDEASLLRLVEGCEVVFHMAAYARMWSKDELNFYRINVIGTEKLVQAAKYKSVRKFILTSTAGRFGPSESGPVTEETKRTYSYMNPYEVTKEMAEQIALEARSDSFEVVVLNPSRVYGPGNLSVSNGVTRMVKLYLKGRFRLIPGNGTYRGNYAFIDDVVEGHLLAMNKGKSGEIYLLGGVNSSLNDFFCQLAEVSCCRRRLLRLPFPIAYWLAAFFDFRTKLTGKEPFITRSWLKRFTINWEVSSAKAVEQLGYRITSLDTGLKKTITALQEAGEI